MDLKYKKLRRIQLEEALQQFEALKAAAVPEKGWIRAIRDALGMSGRQLARRMGVNQQRVARMERDERPGKLTLKTLQAAAEAMDCVFVYGIVPRDSLEQMIRNQARRLAKKQTTRSNQLMRLENQELDEKEKDKAMKELVEEIVRTMPKSLWEES
ncbi:MAG: mobile mystery protein A [Anaerohalosphaeraceae bacterium]